jgi:hypothetical protein
MFSWADFEDAEPDLAAVGRERIERHGFMLVGTTRRDGTARISPVEVRLVESHLATNVVRGSTKERDLRRDDRVVLHDPVLSSADPAEEYILRGRLVETYDERVREAARLWTPPPEFDVFCLDVQHAALLQWSEGELRVTRWSRERGRY